MPEDGFIEVKNIVLEQEEEDFTLPDTISSSNDQFEDYREELNTSSFLPSKKQPTEAKVFESFVETISSPELDIGDEFGTKFSNNGFSTLFPDRLGDPIDNAAVCDISQSETDSYAQKFKHLVRFGGFINGNWCYSFAARSRFGYWAYNVPYMKRLLSQGNFCSKQNRRNISCYLLNRSRKCLNPEHISNLYRNFCIMPKMLQVLMPTVIR